MCHCSFLMTIALFRLEFPATSRYFCFDTSLPVNDAKQKTGSKIICHGATALQYRNNTAPTKYIAERIQRRERRPVIDTRIDLPAYANAMEQRTWAGKRWLQY